MTPTCTIAQSPPQTSSPSHSPKLSKRPLEESPAPDTKRLHLTSPTAQSNDVGLSNDTCSDAPSASDGVVDDAAATNNAHVANNDIVSDDVVNVTSPTASNDASLNNDASSTTTHPVNDNVANDTSSTATSAVHAAIDTSPTNEAYVIDNASRSTTNDAYAVNDAAPTNAAYVIDKTSRTTANDAYAVNDASPSSTLALRALVNSKDSGIIIGKGGKNVIELRTQTNAQITLSNQAPPHSERIITITGTVDSVALAYAMIAQKVGENSNQGGSSNAMPKLSIRLLAPHARMGSIIGKQGIQNINVAGAKVKEIQEKCQVFITASEEMLPASNERSITISGSSGGINQAVAIIAQILLENAGRSVNVILYKPPTLGSKQQPRTKTIPDPSFPQAAQLSQFPPIMIPAYQQYPTDPQQAHQYNASLYAAYVQQYQIAQQYATPEIVSNNEPIQPQPLTPQRKGDAKALPVVFSKPVHYAAPTIPAKVQPSPAIQQRGGSPVAHMYVNKLLAGAIIGKGGSRINEIRQLTGCVIKIEEMQDEQRLITVSGSQEAAQLAMFMLKQRVDSQNSKNASN